jgi:catechol 2,3-dioxygenase-like lactoylglutathione lyase family enzyme
VIFFFFLLFFHVATISIIIFKTKHQWDDSYPASPLSERQAMKLFTISLCVVVFARSCLGLIPSCPTRESPRGFLLLYNYLADGGYIDSETLKSSDEQQEILMPNFDGKVVQWFKKEGDRVSADEAILSVESTDKGNDGFRINTDIQASNNGYLAARYKLEGDMVDARNVLATLVSDQASLASFVPSSDASSQSKSWWASAYKPGRPDPFEAESSLRIDDLSTSTSTSTASVSQPSRFSSSASSSTDSTLPTTIRPSRPDPFQQSPTTSAVDKASQKRSISQSISASSISDNSDSVRTNTSFESDEQSSWPAQSAQSAPFYERQPNWPMYPTTASSPGSPSLKRSILGKTGSMSLGESTLPNDGSNNRQSSPSPYFFRTSGPDDDTSGTDYVEFLEARGMRDDYVPQDYMGQAEQSTRRRQRIRYALITRARNRTTPSNYDIAASTVGGCLFGALIGLAGLLYPEVGLDMSRSLALANLDPAVRNVVPPVVWGMLVGSIGYAGGIADNDVGYSIRHIFGLGNSVKYGLQNLVTSTRQTVEKTANAALRLVSGKADPPLRVHHITIKTRDIISAMEFYSLLGFESKYKFRVGQARATWLENVVIGAGRIELIEVPSSMLQEGSGGRQRALDRVRNQELLGLNHLTLDVSDVIRKKGLVSLSEFLGFLNDTSYELYGKGLRLAVEVQKQAVGDRIYETAFLYDPDGSLIEIQHRTNERTQEILSSSSDYWELTGGQGLVDSSSDYRL